MVRRDKVVIVGAGPASLFCAQELLNSGRNYDIKVFDMGAPISERWCPETQACNCRTCYVIEGGGGAGGFSDGKLPYSLARGTQMEQIFDPSLEPVLWEMDETVVRHAGEGHWYEPRQEKSSLDWESRGLDFSTYPLRHVGSDGIRRFTEGMTSELERGGVDFFYDCEVTRLTRNYAGIPIGVHIKGSRIPLYRDWFDADIVILAPGIQGLPWIADQMEEFGVDMLTGPAGIGMRVETPIEDMACLFGEFYDWKVVKDTGNDITFRSFCCNSGGSITNQYHKSMGVRGVNGHASINPKLQTRSANFAVVAKIGTRWADRPDLQVQRMAREINSLTGGHTAVQRLSHFMKGEVSWDTHDVPFRTNFMAREGVDIGKFLLPTLLEGFRGFIQDIVDVTGTIDPEQALVYAPELKYPARRIPVSLSTFRLPGYDNLYVIGDATGYVDSFVAAGLTGIVAARDIAGIAPTT